ncbi:hypothetical protein DHEL01_v213118 [Diaporthe helianthi]|uniref:Uncharacterized protein n=1 Tax=Diaporthe helianthi TaxID=158607 RepID=A0A2P5HE05_DIAHE|nr:hypothetical protein DHEL01_v213118 [Diaporthe helianthi]
MDVARLCSPSRTGTWRSLLSFGCPPTLKGSEAPVQWRGRPNVLVDDSQTAGAGEIVLPELPRLGCVMAHEIVLKTIGESPVDALSQHTLDQSMIFCEEEPALNTPVKPAQVRKGALIFVYQDFMISVDKELLYSTYPDAVQSSPAQSVFGSTVDVQALAGAGLKSTLKPHNEGVKWRLSETKSEKEAIAVAQGAFSKELEAMLQMAANTGQGRAVAGEPWAGLADRGRDQALCGQTAPLPIDLCPPRGWQYRHLAANFGSGESFERLLLRFAVQQDC